MALSQIVWNHITGTEDQLFEDCMKVQNEPKRVGTHYTYICNPICFPIYPIYLTYDC